MPSVKWSCMEMCQRPDFPIATLLTAKSRYTKHPRKMRATYYNYKHREAGFGKCKNCNYITAYPIKLGDRCPCCKTKLSRSIYHKEAKHKSEYKRIE